MLELLQVATVILGATTTLLSLYLAHKFYRVKHELSSPLAFMLGAEFVAGLVTVLFSINSMLHTIEGVDPALWNTLSPELAIVMRWFLFITVGATSIHLFRSLKRLTN
jgi:hypothetical protein